MVKKETSSEQVDISLSEKNIHDVRLASFLGKQKNKRLVSQSRKELARIKTKFNAVGVSNER